MATESGRVVARNILVFTKGFLKEVNKDMKKVERTLRNRIRQNISLTDHSLEELAAMGHPYAVRAPREIHSPSYSVHKQSGEMLRGLISGTEEADVTGGKLVASAWAGIDEAVEHAPMVIFGTSKMVPRDFLRGSAAEVRDETISTLSRSLKSAVISFDGERVQL